jgi:hypothetical protein
MGTVYEMAYLRIAAAGASHCEDGLYGDRICPSLKVIFQVDVADESEDVIQHAIHLSAGGGSRIEPNESLLTTRAWCFQEARLSRRTVSFMRPGICWDCRDISYDTFDERDCVRNYRRVNWTSWESNIEEYSCGNLTYESDRLSALEGLANEFSKRWKDAHYFGILRDGLPRQLLWRTDRPQYGMTGLPELPSWTWAAWPGEKQFLYKRYPIPDDNAGVVARFIQLEQDDRTLKLEGCLIPCTVAPKAATIGDIGFAITPENYKNWVGEDIYSHMSLYSRFSPEFCLTNTSQSYIPARLVWAEVSGVNQPVGMVQVDREADGSELFFCCLLMARRLPNDPLRQLYDNPDDGLEGVEDEPDLPDWVGNLKSAFRVTY